ncbi:ABC transporter ATPase [Parapedobacter sp. 10938]|uniref:ABC transporter ATPase n=1 Tax=Parapedobacter flavus TaxID=3110225 RepID=UPI002DBFAE41|nr:ABC transporter ATPase [Parapedobacter sp. 10938]MEC3878390.1 ABC transporter ATPase [Parapedobacter sp. 10938]
MQRIWIYQADRQLTAADKAKVQDKLALFTADWKAHGQPLAAKAEIRYDRFIILMVDDAIAPPTGCSIDKSVYLLKEIEEETGLNLFDRLQMAYRKGEQIVAAPRHEFERLIAEKEVTEDTIVFNNLITSYPELDTHWEVPMKESWHAQVFL